MSKSPNSVSGDARCRQCRRAGEKLFLKGARCYTKKCAFERRPTPPGQHGVRRRKVGEYGFQLREKQKVRRTYGVLERQFRNYFVDAENRPGVTGESLLRSLELRLDNVVYRMGIASSRAQARQFVVHRHITVDGQLVDRPSFRVKPGQTIGVKARSEGTEPFQVAAAGGHVDVLPKTPGYVEVELDKLQAKLVRRPKRAEVPVTCDVQLVVEYYAAR